MPDAPHCPDASNPRLQALLAEYRAAAAVGRPPTAEELLARRPDTTPELARALAEALSGEATLSPPAAPTPVRAAPSAITVSFGAAAGATSVFAGRHLGDYELLEEVARGGMGVVFKAREKSLGRIVAVKMILAGGLASAEQVRRFRHEAEEAGRLDHPNVVPIYHVG